MTPYNPAWVSRSSSAISSMYKVPPLAFSKYPGWISPLIVFPNKNSLPIRPWLAIIAALVNSINGNQITAVEHVVKKQDDEEAVESDVNDGSSDIEEEVTDRSETPDSADENETNNLFHIEFFINYYRRYHSRHGPRLAAGLASKAIHGEDPATEKNREQAHS